MKNENIKEILKYLANNNTDYEEDGHTYKILELDECKLLSGYITSLEQQAKDLKADYGSKSQVERDLLEQENERLKEEIEDISVSHFSLFKQYANYKLRNKKALEYNDKNIHSQTLNNILRGDKDE